MKKASFLLVLFLGLFVSAQAHAPADLFVGKWEVLVVGTPNGDAKFLLNLARKEGKLVGEMTLATDAQTKIPVTVTEETAESLAFAFEAQGYNVTIDLKKVDDDNLKGSLLNMFDATAKRI